MDGLLHGLWSLAGTLESVSGSAWLYAVVPLVLAAAIVCAYRFGAAPFARFADAVRGLRHDDRTAFGTMHPLAATGLSVALVHGAVAFVGTATAVGLGGVGVLPWTWLACIAIAFVRIGELALARTSAPGTKKRKPAGSLSARLEGAGGFRRPLGFVIRGAAIATALLFFGLTQGLAVGDAIEGLAPGVWPHLGILAALIAIVLAVAPLDRVMSIAAIIAGLAALLLFGIFLAAGFTDPSRFFGALGGSFGQAVSGMPAVTPHSGAFFPETLEALVLGTLPPLFAATAIDGAIFAQARAKTTKQLAGASWVGPMAYGAVATVVGLSIAATGAYYKRVDGERPLSELVMNKSGFETASQRIEASRHYDGYVRLQEGTTIDPVPRPITERAPVRDATYTFDGEPADIALHFEDGRVTRFLVKEDGILEDTSLDRVREVGVHGKMVPLGGRLLGATIDDAFGSDIVARLALAALLLLSGIGGGAAGAALRRMTRRWKPWASYAVGVLPGLGLFACVIPGANDLASFGWVAAGLSAIAGALGVAALAAEAADSLKTRGARAEAVAVASAPAKRKRPKSGDDSSGERRNVG